MPARMRVGCEQARQGSDRRRIHDCISASYGFSFSAKM